MDNRPLKIKAMETAIDELSKSITPKMANRVYLKWEVFHNEPQFKRAIQAKKMKFSTLKKKR